MKVDNLDFKINEFWKFLDQNLLTNVSTLDLSKFREPGSINNRLATWDPYDRNSCRYYKNILYNLIISMPDKFFYYYKKIGNTNIGNPIFVTVRKIKINFDYTFSVQEILFCEETLKSINTICEIGAGFGRTCHSIIRNFSNIHRYTIIDLPSCLKLSQRYLKKVLDHGEYKKIKFVENDNASEIKSAELFINIDSFAEMDARVVKNYLSLINDKGKYFYSRNTVCKYHPSTIGLTNYDKIQLKNAFSTGLCTEIYDIFNEEELNKARINYNMRYCPLDKCWYLVKSKISEPWQYYQHSLFQNSC
ncbi:methyltransferase [Candidatus Magnetomorum sp. HK-1]|nr:methyltransferase [Candidatus Magnetomorum sp. HK-1]